MVAGAAEKRVEASLSFVIVVLFDLVIDNIVKKLKRKGRGNILDCKKKKYFLFEIEKLVLPLQREKKRLITISCM
jgi:hypothetical protein